MSKHGGVAERLQQRLGQLLQRVGKIEGDLRSVRDNDWTERATETQNDAVLEGLDELSLEEVRHIHTALGRIESGDYDNCAVCGKPIGAARLAAMPTAVTCVGCAPQ